MGRSVLKPAPVYTKRQINTIAAWLVHDAIAPGDRAGSLAVEMVEAAGYLPSTEDWPNSSMTSEGVG